MKRAASTLLILIIALGLFWPAPTQATFAPPAGFTEQLVVGGLGAPNAFDWLPPSENNDILIASQDGIVHRWNGTALTQVLDISASVCFLGEMGLLGLAVDPAFSAGQRFVYLYYTHRRGNCGDPNDAASRANRVSRFTVAGNGLLGNERVLIDNISAFGQNHNGGDLHFDKNELLYVSVGDAGRDLQSGLREQGNFNARRLDLLNGKVLRITRDGSIPAGNPFSNGVSCAATGMVPGAPVDATKAEQQTKKERKKKSKKNKKKKNRKGGKKRNKHNRKRNLRDRKRERRNNQHTNNPLPPPSAICQEIFAFGLRNPFRFAFDPNDNSGPQRFYINDVGGGAWEEIDSGAAGADYGWNVREGPCPIGVVQANCASDPRFVDPIFAYARSGGLPDNNFDGCRTITGGAFVPNGANWPAPFNNYLFTDLACGKLFALNGEGAGATATVFANGAANLDAVHLGFGPDDALYYTTFQGGGELRRIERN